jgi:hypothetical protein
MEGKEGEPSLAKDPKKEYRSSRVDLAKEGAVLT